MSVSTSLAQAPPVTVLPMARTVAAINALIVMVMASSLAPCVLDVPVRAVVRRDLEKDRRHFELPVAACLQPTQPQAEEHLRNYRQNGMCQP
jgi:hypothetical protein